MVAPDEFGMPDDEGRTQSESDQENQSDGGQALIRNRLQLACSIDLVGAVLSGMQEAVLERPVLGQVHPAVVLIFPAAMA